MGIEVGLLVGDVADETANGVAWDPGGVASGDEGIPERVEVDDAAFIVVDVQAVEQLSECDRKIGVAGIVWPGAENAVADAGELLQSFGAL